MERVCLSPAQHSISMLKRNNKSITWNRSCSKNKAQHINQGLHYLLVLFLFVLLSSNKSSAFPNQVDNWIYDTSINSVEFYHAIVECNGKKVVFLKFNNKNNHKVEVSWKEVFTTQAKSKQDGIAGQKKLTLLKGETSASDCAETINRSCLILPKDISAAYAVEIFKFEFKDISVSSIL